RLTGSSETASLWSLRTDYQLSRESIMATCEHYQGQLLAHLYGLLEEAERQELQAHLDQCAGCQAALAQAKNQQQLLAAAAKTEFAAVKFQPPAEIVPARAEVPALRISRARRSWSGLAVAASILVLAGLGAPAGWWTATYLKEKAVVQGREAELKDQLARV